MINATKMFIVTEILQTWIPGTSLDAGYYDNLNYRKCPLSTKLFSPQDHFKPPKICVHELPVKTKTSLYQFYAEMTHLNPENQG